MPSTRRGLVNSIATKYIIPLAWFDVPAYSAELALLTHAAALEHVNVPRFVLRAGAVHMLMEILENMAAGRGVTLIPQHAELTTVHAAELLNVSRPFLIRLLESKDIPYRTIGKHRRMRMEDVMAYKSRIDRELEQALDALVADAQDQNMGY